MRAAAVVDDFISKVILGGRITSGLVHVVADEVDWGVGAAAGRREGADGALTKFARPEVERQQTVRGSVSQQDLLAHRRERTADGGDQAGLANAASEREDSEDRGAGLLLTHRGCLRQLLTGLLEDAFEREPASGDAFARVLQGIGNRGLRRWRLKGNRLLRRRGGGWSIQRCRTRGGRPKGRGGPRG